MIMVGFCFNFCSFQDINNSSQGLVSSSHTESQSEGFLQKNSLSMEVRDQTEHKIEIEEPLIACKKALVCLDAAAESAVQLFSKLGDLASRQEILTGPEADLYDHAAELLPLVAEKVKAIAKLVKTSKE